MARLHRAGELTAIRVPTPAEEAVRDLVRARADVLDDRKRMQQRLSAVLVRHGRIWRGGGKWTAAHRQWIAGQVFDEPALNRVVATQASGADQSRPRTCPTVCPALVVAHPTQDPSPPIRSPMSARAPEPPWSRTSRTSQARFACSPSLPR